MSSRRTAIALALALALACSQAVPKPGEPAGRPEIPSCVAGSPPLPVSADDAGVLLDAPDRLRFEAVATQRFPALRQSGFAAVQVLLLRRSEGAGGWAYVTLLPDQGPGGTPCFTAVLDGAAFEFTPEFVRKYFPALQRS